jgi:hypothetical protein
MKFRQFTFGLILTFANHNAWAPPHPSASIKATPTSGVAPLTVNFVGGGGCFDSEEDIPEDLYSHLPSSIAVSVCRWHFGDGQTGSGINISHTYDKPGVYTVTLNFSDGWGVPIIGIETINVSEPDNDDILQNAIQWTIAEGGNGHWYDCFEGMLTWHEARRIAKALGGDLATITSENEDQWVYQNVACHTENAPILWLGGTDAFNENQWTWVTGEKWAYSHWAADQPDNFSDNEDGAENYLAYWKSGNEWNDLGGHFRAEINGFIVEYEEVEADYHATYSSNGELHIPYVEIPNGDTYDVYLQQRPPGFVFELELEKTSIRD